MTNGVRSTATIDSATGREAAPVRAAARTLDMLEAYAAIRRPMTVSEMARVLKVPVSSCFALFRTLEGRGYLYATLPGTSYYPTARLWIAAENITRADHVLSAVGDALRELRDASGETAMLGKLSRNRVVLLGVEAPPGPARYMPQVGDLRPVYATSIGKAVLGTLPDKEVDAILSEVEFSKFTDATLPDAASLKQDLAKSRARGWYANTGETIPDFTSLSLPLRLRGDLFALAVTGPTMRVDADLEKYLGYLRHAADSIQGN